jgi:hypothetical protein
MRIQGPRRIFLSYISFKYLNIGKYDLSLIEKSKLFTPIYTIPSGWNDEMKNAINNFLNSHFLAVRRLTTWTKAFNLWIIYMRAWPVV